MRKPDSLIYGTEDRPPPALLVLLAIQHLLVLSIQLVTPVLIARAASLALPQATNLISLTMVGLALAIPLQITRRGPFGSGQLAMPGAQSVFLPGSLIAARLGGLPMVAGLILISAALEMVIARFLHRLRGILPAELSGLIVLVTGLGIAQTGMADIVGGMASGSGNAWLPSLAVAVGTLALMVGCSVWGRGALRTLGAFVGLVCGYGAGQAAGLVDPAALQEIGQAPLLMVPTVASALPAFNVGIILPALLTGLAITLNSTGALTAAQMTNDADWKRQDMEGLSSGLLADAVGAAMGGLIGGCGIGASGTSVGLAANSGATSRVIGYAVAAGLLMLSLVPKFALLVVAVPPPVLGAALVYLSCTLLVSGITIISSRLLDTRKTFTLGIAFAFAVAGPAMLRAAPVLPDWMSPVIASPLLAAALVAILINPVLRIGIRRTLSLAIPAAGLPHQTVADFIGRAGAAWGARREVIAQAQGPIAECLDTLLDAGLATGDGWLTLSFDELRLEALISWQGEAIHLTTRRPTKEELLADDASSRRLAGYLIGRLASRVSSRASPGRAELHLVFDH